MAGALMGGWVPAPVCNTRVTKIFKYLHGEVANSEYEGRPAASLLLRPIKSSSGCQFESRWDRGSTGSMRQNGLRMMNKHNGRRSHGWVPAPVCNTRVLTARLHTVYEVRPAASPPLWRRLRAKHTVTWRHVAGHSGNKWNDYGNK